MPLKMRLMALVILLLMQGCSSTSVFKSYPSQAKDYKSAIINDNISATADGLSKLEKKKDGLLYAQERGRLYQLNQQTEQSLASFEKVYQLYEAIDEKARVSAGDIGAGALALASNDNVIPYQGSAHERIFALHSQALNYLSLSQPESAAVELRRAANLQRRLELEKDKSIQKAEQQAKKENIDLSAWKDAPELVGLSQAAGQVKSAFLSAYTYYTSAVIWEALGDSNAALVDYKKAYEINPSNQQILQDIQRLDSYQTIAKDKSHVVILYEDGFINEKRSFDLSWPYFTADSVTYLNIAFPYYKQPKHPSPLVVYTQSGQLGQTQMIANFDAMAAKALMEQVPLMIVRMVLRARVKHEIHAQSTEHAGIIGSIFSTLYNLASEQADRRSWLTLPSNAQMLRTELAPGQHEIRLDVQGHRYTLDVETLAGRTTMLRVIHVGSRFIVQQYQL